MKDYEVGDEVWFIKPYADNILAIKSTITYVDDQFRKKHSTAELFYDFDFVIGHSVSSDEFLDTMGEAISYMTTQKRKGVSDITFHQWQEETRGFVANTWEGGHPGFEKPIPNKKRGLEWFNLNDV